MTLSIIRYESKAKRYLTQTGTVSQVFPVKLQLGSAKGITCGRKWIMQSHDETTWSVERNGGK